MRDTTLLFLVKKEQEQITEICLAMKKRGFGAGRYNGTGGKLEALETIEDAVRRETKEEIGVEVTDITKVGELTFMFPHKEEWNQLVHVYFAYSWNGVITESEEMKPEWFKVKDIPYNMMWPDDTFWLPKVIEGEYVVGRFVFGKGDVILEQEISTR